MDLKCSETIVPTPYARMENLHLTCLSRTTPVSALACDEFHESELISLFILSWYSLLSLSFQKSLLFGTSYISFRQLINFVLPHGKKKMLLCTLFKCELYARSFQIWFNSCPSGCTTSSCFRKWFLDGLLTSKAADCLVGSIFSLFYYGKQKK